MPRTGRPATPTQTLKIRGTFRPDRHGSRPDANATEPATLPPPPDWLGEQAASHYHHLGAVLVGRGLMNAGYGVALAILSDSVADMVAASAVGSDVELSVKIKLRDQVYRGLREFGLTPSSLAGVKGAQAETKEEDPLASYRQTA